MLFITSRFQPSAWILTECADAPLRIAVVIIISVIREDPNQADESMTVVERQKNVPQDSVCGGCKATKTQIKPSSTLL